MKPEFAASFVTAVICHALLLFGIRLGTPAKAMTMSDEPASVDVNLVEAAPAPAASVPPDPVPEPEPAPTPESPVPMPEPVATPEPVQETASPTPEPAPVPMQKEAMSTPAPQPPRQKTRPRAPSSLLKKAAAAASSSSTAMAPSAGSTRGATTSSRPRYRNNPRPDYPPDALRMRQEGLVMLSVQVSADGHAIDVSLKRSSGVPSLDQAAMRAVRQWTFEPARQAGFPVASEVDVPVRFTLDQANR